MPRKETVIPSAHRLIQSLRDIGYDLPAAIADLCDNSIAAEATEIRVDFRFEGGEAWIRIVDDGGGMTAATIKEALRFGTHRGYDEELDLGRFGLGLKTASLSQCRRLTVASRADGRPVVIRRWDLDHIEQTDAWDLLTPTPVECHPEVIAPLHRRRSGTVVFWERLDRILEYALPSGRAAENGVTRLCREVEEHLAMVFHRFLAGTAKRKLPLVIYVNGNQLQPWDPFAVQEEKTQSLRPQILELEHEGRSYRVRVKPYILPHEGQFSSVQAHRLAGGPKKWNAQQGFYIYRNDRMLQSGGWNRLRALDEHVKLARIAVDFPASADAAFKINVAKASILFPAQIREELTRLVAEVCRKADEAYRKKERKAAGRHAPPMRGQWSASGVIGEIRDPASGGAGRGDPATYGTKAGKSGAGALPRVFEPSGGFRVPQEPVATQVVSVLRHELHREQELLTRVLQAVADINEEFRSAVAMKETESA